jgi:hypothetical protein
MSMSNECPRIKGKTVAVYVRNRPQTPVVLGGCAFEVRESRLFLVGTSLAEQRTSESWLDGVRRAIAWDAVDEYLLFDTPDDYYARRSVGAAEADDRRAGMPFNELPAGPQGEPVDPSGVHMQPETPLEIGTTVLAFSQGRWWRAEVVGLAGDDQVRLHFPGWDNDFDVTLAKTELQVDLSDSIESRD